jgi:hypothetical protein
VSKLEEALTAMASSVMASRHRDISSSAVPVAHDPDASNRSRGGTSGAFDACSPGGTTTTGRRTSKGRRRRSHEVPDGHGSRDLSRDDVGEHEKLRSSSVVTVLTASEPRDDEMPGSRPSNLPADETKTISSTGVALITSYT